MLRTCETLRNPSSGLNRGPWCSVAAMNHCSHCMKQLHLINKHKQYNKQTLNVKSNQTKKNSSCALFRVLFPYHLVFMSSQNKTRQSVSHSTVFQNWKMLQTELLLKKKLGKKWASSSVTWDTPMGAVEHWLSCRTPLGRLVECVSNGSLHYSPARSQQWTYRSIVHMPQC